MYKTYAQCENWEDILNLIVKLTSENKQLKKEKQQLINELMNIKLKIQQEEKRIKYTYKVLISEME